MQEDVMTGEVYDPAPLIPGLEEGLTHLYLVDGIYSPCADDVLNYHEPTQGRPAVCIRRM